MFVFFAQLASERTIQQATLVVSPKRALLADASIAVVEVERLVVNLDFVLHLGRDPFHYS